jgi:hypothetical protein
MNDADGPQISAWFYHKLFQCRGRVDLEDIPYALDDAVCRLRKQGVPIDRWSTFIHIGA